MAFLRTCRPAFSFLAASLLVACGVPQAEHDAVKAENQRLRSAAQELQSELEALQSEASADRVVAQNVVLQNTEVRTLHSAISGQTYQIKVKLPRGYDPASDVTYPVLYVTDAETNFGGVSYIVQRLAKDKLIPRILVVGIAYDTDYDDFYRLRSRDLTPMHDPVSKIGHGGVPDPTGGAPQFLRFLAEELFPFVETTYRARSHDRALYGHSYGGLFGSWVLLHHSDLFQRYLLLSPSLWFKDGLLLGEARTLDLRFEGTRLYMGSGRLEPRIDDLHEDFIEILNRRRPPGLEIRSEVLENETHRTIFGRAFTNGLRFLYADTR